MTLEEAKINLEVIREHIENPTEEIRTGIAITSLTEGIEALEKQIPKKLIKEKSIKYDREFYKYENTKTKCPSCGKLFLITGDNYCSNCGQRLEWERKNERYYL